MKSTLRPITAADDAAMARVIREVMTEHGAGGPGFAIHDLEVNAMSAAYAGDRAGYFIAEVDGTLTGGAGFGPLAGGPDDTCELRKMYLLPAGRGLGLGRALLARCLDEAKQAGFGAMYLETLHTMGRARAMYEAHGFALLPAPLGSTGHFGCNAWMLRRL